MVELVVKDVSQVTQLERYLQNKKIKYVLVENKRPIGVNTPYIIVNGAPLDEIRAMKWMEEK